MPKENSTVTDPNQSDKSDDGKDQSKEKMLPQSEVDGIATAQKARGEKIGEKRGKDQLLASKGLTEGSLDELLQLRDAFKEKGLLAEDIAELQSPSQNKLNQRKAESDLKEKNDLRTENAKLRATMRTENTDRSILDYLGGKNARHPKHDLAFIKAYHGDEISDTDGSLDERKMKKFIDNYLTSDLDRVKPSGDSGGGSRTSVESTNKSSATDEESVKKEAMKNAFIERYAGR